MPGSTWQHWPKFLYVFRGKRGKLIKIFWYDGFGRVALAKRLEKGRFIWPSPADGAVSITPAQLGYLLEGIDWRATADLGAAGGWLSCVTMTQVPDRRCLVARAVIQCGDGNWRRSSSG